MLINIISIYALISIMYLSSMITTFSNDERLYSSYVCKFSGYNKPKLMAILSLIIESIFWPISMIKKDPLN